MEGFKNLGLPGQIIVTAILAGAIIFTGWKFFPNFQQQHKEIKSKESRLSDLNREIELGLNLEKKLPELEREIANLQEQLEELKAIIPPVRDDAELIQKIHSLAQRSRLRVSRILPQRLRRREFFDEYPLSLEVAGNYHDLAKFFARLANLPRIFNVNNVRMSNPGANAEHSVAANFLAVTFIYREETEKKLAPPR